ncbi:MAG: hypothetical protein OXF28_04230 [Thaumarchaeota archaeon]|nr:hypothetical protein [Nitrososphaerota archaeon]MCY3976319.1 hypothetical protein [Nitrososphaerota archaeon]
MRKYKCKICQEDTIYKYVPMKQWKLDVDCILCGKCYSRRIHEYYPGKHKKINKIR